MPQPKIYAAVLNHFGSLSDLAATLGATVVDETLCFSGLTGQAVSDLMEQHGRGGRPDRRGRSRRF